MAKWFIEGRSKTLGPFSSSQLKQLAASEKLKPTSNIKRDTDADWFPASKVKGLFPSASSSSASQATAPLNAPAPPIKQPDPIAPVPLASPPAFPAVSMGQASSTIECRFCGEDIKPNAAKCKHCGEFLNPAMAPAQFAAPIPQPQQQTVVNVTNHVPRWNAGVAAILSFLLPGLGQLYKGQPINGIAWFFMTIIGYFCFIFPGLVLHLLCICGAAMGDPYK